MIPDFKDYDPINEKAITFGGKAYPKYDNILILAGGGGSGKGFAKDHAMAFNGKNFDVDEIKTQLSKFKEGSELDKDFVADYGKHLSEIDFGNSDDVQNIHAFAKKHNIAKNMHSAFFKNQATKTQKDNCIFDVTLNDYPKFHDILSLAAIGGYDTENIHIVWVLNNYENAKEQNKSRKRRVPEEVLKEAHEGVAKFFKYIILDDQLRGTLPELGDIWIYFGSTNTGDVELEKSENGGEYISDYTVVQLKKKGEPLAKYDDIMNMEVKPKKYDDGDNGTVLRKRTLRELINEYVPDSVSEF